jgi:hypothetical protein
MTQPLVVLTYPGHFLLTALTIQSYLQHHNPCSITVIADDLSPLTWPGYLDHCQQQYNCKIVPTSSMPVATAFANNHWIRQQMVKLHLDQVLDTDCWFFTDGDVEYCSPVAYNTTPYSIVRGGPERTIQDLYVSTMLGISNPGIRAAHPDIDWTADHSDQVCVSNPPFRTMWSDTLQQLRSHIEQLHNNSMIAIHQQLKHLMSEWELIANFQTHVLKQNIELVYYPTVPLSTVYNSMPNQPDYCGTSYQGDSEFDANWWQQKGIQDIRNRTTTG